MNDELFEFGAFMTDDEAKQMLDSIVKRVGELCAAEDNKTAIVNPDKIQQVLYVYEVLKFLTKSNRSVKVTYEIHEPYKSMGSVSVSGEHIKFKNPNGFLKAVELSSNFEVYPKTDGTVRMDFTFHGLTKSIKQ